MDFYSSEQRNFQDQFETRNLADRMELGIVQDNVEGEYGDFISSRDFFFLSTVSANGEPTVSYKGGPVGLVHVVDPKTLEFCIYDGNGMFLSLGNVEASAKIGMLFMDFETPNRVRVQATASVTTDTARLERFPGAVAVVEAKIDSAFVNCARYIHKHSRSETSKYVPDEAGNQPFPAWKRIDAFQDVLAPADAGRAESEGGVITVDEYRTVLESGES